MLASDQKQQQSTKDGWDKNILRRVSNGQEGVHCPTHYDQQPEGAVPVPVVVAKGEENAKHDLQDPCHRTVQVSWRPIPGERLEWEDSDKLVETWHLGAERRFDGYDFSAAKRKEQDAQTDR